MNNQTEKPAAFQSVKDKDAIITQLRSDLAAATNERDSWHNATKSVDRMICALIEDRVLDCNITDKVHSHSEFIYRMGQEIERLKKERDDFKALAAQNRHAGREEALAIIMQDDAEEPFDSTRKNYQIGDTGDYGVKWELNEM